ncbi:MAG: hypothetical protein AAB336_06075 [Acidobacteriota bacterium]
MCVQTVSLIQAEIERNKIPTVSISLLKEVTSILKPSRALFVPFKMGYPLGLQNNADLQHKIIAQALSLLEKNNTPILADFAPIS